MKAKNILALAKSTAERTYFEDMVEPFSDLFTISIADSYQDNHNYDGLFCFERQELGVPQLLFSFEEKKGYVFTDPHPFSVLSSWSLIQPSSAVASSVSSKGLLGL